MQCERALNRRRAGLYYVRRREQAGGIFVSVPACGSSRIRETRSAPTSDAEDRCARVQSSVESGHTQRFAPRGPLARCSGRPTGDTPQIRGSLEALLHLLEMPACGWQRLARGRTSALQGLRGAPPLTRASNLVSCMHEGRCAAYGRQTAERDPRRRGVQVQRWSTRDPASQPSSLGRSHVTTRTRRCRVGCRLRTSRGAQPFAYLRAGRQSQSRTSCTCGHGQCPCRDAHSVHQPRQPAASFLRSLDPSAIYSHAHVHVDQRSRSVLARFGPALNGSGSPKSWVCSCRCAL
ncbi:hypothetical protein PsYK624_172940 [Phanerochaete sordida]|uniref:Uncharacterized protein n=1 Tax=Phanerochaete sordida TaxID=48140 RepID=A0A9P3LPG6_9APHY|nr:hypothetical protein PsYK624_172940 [Phanerochaete sordida]